MNICRKVLNFDTFSHPAFQKIIIDPKDYYDHLENKEGLLQIDYDFIKYINEIGSKGKKLSKLIKESSIQLFSFYKENDCSDEYRGKVWSLWVSEKNESISPFLSYLAQAVWEGRCANIWNRRSTGNPSLVKPVIERLIPILGPNKSKKFAEKEGQIICYGQKGEPLFTAPAVDVNMISAFQKGIKEIGTLTGHKMLRWQLKLDLKSGKMEIKTLG